jgi:hypothetical protein
VRLGLFGIDGSITTVLRCIPSPRGITQAQHHSRPVHPVEPVSVRRRNALFKLFRLSMSLPSSSFVFDLDLLFQLVRPFSITEHRCAASRNRTGKQSRF